MVAAGITMALILASVKAMTLFILSLPFACWLRSTFLTIRRLTKNQR